MQVIKNAYYRAKELKFWNRLIPDLVNSQPTAPGRGTEPVVYSVPFAGATMPTATLIPPVSR